MSLWVGIAVAVVLVTAWLIGLLKAGSEHDQRR
jgi:hypothetical protein